MTISQITTQQTNHEGGVLHEVVAYEFEPHAYKFALSIDRYDQVTSVPHANLHRD